MSGRDDTGKVTIGRAVEMLQREFPDVTISSLRFLEREGLVSAERKPGGHRLYDPASLDRIRQIKRWQADRVPLKEIRERLDQAPRKGDYAGIVSGMITSLLQHDIAGAMRYLWDVQRSGAPLLDICDSILTPMLVNLGDEKGNHLIPVDVQMELDQQLIAFLAITTRKPGLQPNMPVIVAACPPWERHDIPLRMLVALLMERGVGVHYIGAQVDSTFLRDAIGRLRPDLVLVSLTVEPPASAVNWFHEVSSAMEPPRLVVAGGTGSLLLADMPTINVRVLGAQTYAESLQQLLPKRDQPLAKM